MRPAEAAIPELVSIDELDQNIIDLATRINIAICELIVLIREFDERVGFLKWGFENCAEWLAWRCDISIATANNEEALVGFALRHTSPSVAASCAWATSPRSILPREHLHGVPCVFTATPSAA